METKPATIKKTFDIPKGLFVRVMNYANQIEVYKFSPAVIDLLEKR